MKLSTLPRPEPFNGRFDRVSVLFVAMGIDDVSDGPTRVQDDVSWLVVFFGHGWISFKNRLGLRLRASLLRQGLIRVWHPVRYRSRRARVRQT
jgi:hypothetical protein